MWHQKMRVEHTAHNERGDHITLTRGQYVKVISDYWAPDWARKEIARCPWLVVAFAGNCLVVIPKDVIEWDP